MLYKQAYLLLLAWFIAPASFAQVPASDSLRVSIYQEEEISTLDSMPEVFPRHRPARLVLKCESRIPSRATILQIADSLAALRKLTGLPYYSHTEKEMKTLFKNSEVLAHPQAQKGTNDPLFCALPMDTSFYIRQIDNRLGTMIYRVRLQASDQQVTFLATNVVPIEKFGVQLAEIGDCILFIAIQKHGHYLNFTAWQWLRFKGGLLGIFLKKESFVNRLKAVSGFYLKTMAIK